MTGLRMAAGTLGAVLVLSVPLGAHAAPVAASDDCTKAKAVAVKADSDYEAMKKAYLDRIAQGGHPDASERQALADAQAERDTTASQAQRLCGP